MAMKKTSGGDSPLRQGAGKSFWTLPISGRRRRWITMYSGKVIEYLGFSRRGVFIGEGASLEVAMVGLTIGGRGPAQAAPPGGVAHQWLLSVSPSDLWKLSGKIWLQDLFCPIPRIFPVYHFWNTKTAENRKLALWQLVNRLVPENA